MSLAGFQTDPSYHFFVVDGFVTEKPLQNRTRYRSRDVRYEKLMAEHLSLLSQRWRTSYDHNKKRFGDTAPIHAWVLGSDDKAWSERRPSDLIKFMAQDNLKPNYRILIVAQPRPRNCHLPIENHARSVGMKQVRRQPFYEQQFWKSSELLLGMMDHHYRKHREQPSSVLSRLGVPYEFSDSSISVSGIAAS